MKRTIYILPILVLFSCASGLDNFHYYEYNIIESAIENYVDRKDKTRIEKIEYISNWVLKKIKYVAEVAGKDEWQTPIETYESRQGDCEDQAILFMYFVNRYFGYEPLLILAKGKKINHYIAEIEGIYYFNIWEEMINYQDPERWIIYLEIGYYYALWMAENEK